jgi:hypothetical protein
MSNGNSFNGQSSHSNGDSMSVIDTVNTEPWYFRIMRPIQDRGSI